ncbi:hypothetical protein [Scytonema sp. PCC 10023]
MFLSCFVGDGRIVTVNLCLSASWKAIAQSAAPLWTIAPKERSPRPA